MADNSVETASPRPFDPAHDAGPLVALIHEVARLTSVQVDAALRHHNLTRAQFLALMTLSRQNGMHQSQIAQSLRMGRSAVGKLLDRLEASGYIRREHDPFDARAVKVFVTGATLSRLEDINHAANARCDEILAPLSAAERENFTMMLTRLRDSSAKDPAVTLAQQT